MENVKAIAARCLFLGEVSSLPVDVMDINIDGKQWTIATYLRSQDILKRYRLEAYAEVVDAFSIKIEKTNTLCSTMKGCRLVRGICT